MYSGLFKPFKHTKLVTEEMSCLNCEVGAQEFQIQLPQSANDYLMIDIPIVLNNYEWLSRVNEYIFDKQPTLTQLLEYIENKYSALSFKKADDDINLLNIPMFKISKFDIEEDRYRKKLESLVSTTKSKLSLPGDSTKCSALFSGNIPGLLLMKEFFELRKQFATNSRIELNLVDDNIYHWDLKLRNFNNSKVKEELKELNAKFGYDYIQLQFHFHDKLYPNYPPFIKSVRPRLNNHLMNRITNMKMVQLNYWSPSRNVNFIINKLQTSLEMSCSIDVSSDMNNLSTYPEGAYHDLESILVKLASFLDIKDEYEQLDTEQYKETFKKEQPKPKQESTSNKNVVWEKGTGYGYGSKNGWDINEYIQIQNEKDNQIKNIMGTLMDNLITYEEKDMPLIYSIINSSYLIPFIKGYLNGTNILDMSKHLEIYKLIFTFLQLLISESSMILFANKSCNTTLYDLLNDLYTEAKNVISLTKTNDVDDYDIANMICVVFEMLEPLYKTYLENEQKKEEEKQEIIKQEQENVNKIHKEYVSTLKPFIFDTCSSINSHTYQSTGQITKNAQKRLAREYSSLIKSLPLTFESSIFISINEKDNRQARVLITGPDGTPYDSGCLIFDFHSGNDYPNEIPKIIFLNHGKKRFNPNLYDCGKVCLSLLGTWQGTKAEMWNPETSTMQQLFVSIQSQILVPQPYFNEPSYESQHNNPKVQEESKQYTFLRRFYTLQHTIYDLLVKPDAYPEFKNVIVNHFKIKKDYIKELMEKWCEEPNNKYQKETIDICKKINEEFDKIN